MKGLINEACAKKIKQNTIRNFIVTIALVCLMVATHVSFEYFYFTEISNTLETDNELTFHLLFASIPSIYVMTYPPSIAVIEFASVFSIDFLRRAMKKWAQDFKAEHIKLNLNKKVLARANNLLLIPFFCT